MSRDTVAWQQSGDVARTREQNEFIAAVVGALAREGQEADGCHPVKSVTIMLTCKTCMVATTH